MGAAPPRPPSPTMPPPGAHPPILGSSLSNDVKDRAKAADGMGFDDTVKTSPQGLQTPPSTAKATLLGQ